VLYVVVVVVTRNEEKEAYPSAEDLVDGGALFERAFGYHFGPHLLHVEHERVQRLLDVRLLLLGGCCKSEPRRTRAK
jgi:hypothetical protein